MKILLAVDGSPYTRKMLAYLSTHLELFAGTGHTLTLLTVQPPLPARARAAVGKVVVNDWYAQESDKVLQPAAKFLQRHGLQARLVWKIGPAGDTIAKVADSGGYDLLMMGSHGHGMLGNLLMGSVATRVLAGCLTPVLLVR